MGSFITDLKDNYKRGDICIRFIYINVGICLITSLISVVWTLFNWGVPSILQYFQLPAWFFQFVKQPWS